MEKEINIAILGSGNGSNAQRIAEYFKDNSQIKISTIISNKKDAYIITRAENLNIPCRYFNRNDFYNTDNVLNYLKEKEIDYVILAGFLWLVPHNLLKAFPQRIINIHPALLPNYGGKGMYGSHVHESVIANKEKESGITIHFVDENYDQGQAIFQAKCQINPDDTADTLAQKIHLLEYEYFPKVIEQVVANQNFNNN
jgi:phosphoribosylglycinamide formyltransferase-1